MDGSFWMVENNPLILKRIDPNRKNVIVEVQPELGTDIRYMKAYQNILLIADEKALFIFDQFGTLLFKLDGIKTTSLSIENDEVLLLSKSEVIKIDPFKGEILSKKETPLEGVSGMIYTGSSYVFIQDKKLFFYRKQN